ncbi:MAG: acyl-ACP--UDP-N-acetylglucosamine O-acyltransferase [Thiobacillus sp.]|nr:acyl-ACP--UDP-N-acetylglucosamine O-acyltransferase [Thiobacillus sp.]
MPKIHPTALVDAGAQLADDVEIGPYSVIGAQVTIGSGTTVGAHAVITGHTSIGEHNRIFHFVSLGEAPQDKKYAGEPTRLEIGDHNVIREFCTFNLGTVQDRGVTTLGSHNWIMAYVHIAHDCVVGNHTIFANNASLAGHAEIGDWVILGGFTGVHQFCKIGAHVMTGISSVVFKDIPPFVMASGQPAAPHGLNNEGLKRRGFSAESLTALKRAYKTLYREGNTLAEAQAKLAPAAEAHAEIRQLLDFLMRAERGIIR